MAKFFPGTNIKLSDFKGSNSKKEELITRLTDDMAAGDIDGMNDAIFSVAYHSLEGPGKGQGNRNVSKVHNGTWEVTADVGDNRSWAETAINSENDVYIQKDGSVITYDDDVGSVKDGKAIGSWGGQGKGENQPHSGETNTHAGKSVNAPTNPVISGGGGNSSANYAKLNSIWDKSFAEEAAAGIGDYGKTDTGAGTRGATGLGGLMLGSDYRRSAPLDWSSIMPELAPLKSQQAIQSGQGKFFQPWATRQATPTSLLNYQKPTGALPRVTYQPPGSPVTSTYTGGSGTTDSGTTDSGTTDSGTTDSGATSGHFMGQNYANQGEYMMLLDTHNKAMQLIRGGRTTRGIGDLMSDPGWVNTEYVKFGGTDLGVGGKSASLADILTGKTRTTPAPTNTAANNWGYSTDLSVVNPGRGDYGYDAYNIPMKSAAATVAQSPTVAARNRTFPALASGAFPTMAAENATGLVNAPMNNNLALLDATVGDRSGYEWQHRTAGGPDAGLLAALFK